MSSRFGSKLPHLVDMRSILMTSFIHRPGGMVLFRDYGLYDHAMVRFKPGHKLSDAFYVRGDGTRAYYFTVEELAALFEETGLFETVSCEYISKETTNRKLGVCVPRVYAQGKFRLKAT